MSKKKLEPKRRVKGLLVEQLEVKYVKRDDEGEVVRQLPYEFPHGKLEKRWVTLLDLSTVEEAPF